MPSSSSSAQAALHTLGARLRELRQEQGLKGRELARLAGWHESKVSKIEYGRQKPTDDDVRTWCAYCGAAGEAADLLASLHAVEEMYVEWRRMERTGLRVAQQQVVPLWERTRRFRIYSSWMVPGPLQTPDYIRAVLCSITARRALADDVEAAVRVRVDKQHVVYEGDHQFAVLLEESVLHHRIGGQATMADQLSHLLRVGAHPSVALGVIPLDTDRSTMWPVEGFWMFDNEQVTVELVSGHLTVTQPYEIAMYQRAFSALHRQAVYGSAARSLILSAIAALDGPMT